MNKFQLNYLNNSNEVLTISAIDSSTRTLLYGYTTDRYTHHVYQESGVLHLVIYNGKQLIEHRSGRDLSVDNIAPNKRLYPEACNFDFCLQLRKLGVALLFMNYVEKRAEKLGLILVHGSTAREFNLAED